MKITTPTPSHKGFTLIELLVVVAIIAILAALGFGAGSTAINNAKKLTAKNECTNLVHAVNGYFDEYSHYPDIGGSGADAEERTESTLMNVLLGIGSGEDQNPKRIRYYQGKEAKGSNGREYGGLLRSGNSAELFDTWRKIESGMIRHYTVSWDANYDDELLDPFKSGNILYQTVIAWSSGKDGEETPGSETAAANRDNVYSWK